MLLLRPMAVVKGLVEVVERLAWQVLQNDGAGLSVQGKHANGVAWGSVRR